MHAHVARQLYNLIDVNKYGTFGFGFASLHNKTVCVAANSRLKTVRGVANVKRDLAFAASSCPRYNIEYQGRKV